MDDDAPRSPGRLHQSGRPFPSLRRELLRVALVLEGSGFSPRFLAANSRARPSWRRRELRRRKECRSGAVEGLTWPPPPLVAPSHTQLEDVGASVVSGRPSFRTTSTPLEVALYNYAEPHVVRRKLAELPSTGATLPRYSDANLATRPRSNPKGTLPRCPF